MSMVGRAGLVNRVIRVTIPMCSYDNRANLVNQYLGWLGYSTRSTGMKIFQLGKTKRWFIGLSAESSISKVHDLTAVDKLRESIKLRLSQPIIWTHDQAHTMMPSISGFQYELLLTVSIPVVQKTHFKLSGFANKRLLADTAVVFRFHWVGGGGGGESLPSRGLWPWIPNLL